MSSELIFISCGIALMRMMWQPVISPAFSDEADVLIEALRASFDPDERLQIIQIFKS